MANAIDGIEDCIGCVEDRQHPYQSLIKTHYKRDDWGYLCLMCSKRRDTDNLQRCWNHYLTNGYKEITIKNTEFLRSRYYYLSKGDAIHYSLNSIHSLFSAKNIVVIILIKDGENGSEFHPLPDHHPNYGYHKESIDKLGDRPWYTVPKEDTIRTELARIEREEMENPRYTTVELTEEQRRELEDFKRMRKITSTEQKLKELNNRRTKKERNTVNTCDRMDADLRDRQKALEEELKHMQGQHEAKLKELVDEHRKLEVELVKLRDEKREITSQMCSNTCAICFEDYNDNDRKRTAIVPCGHVFCRSCVNQIQECATCRGPKTRTQDVFMSGGKKKTKKCKRKIIKKKQKLKTKKNKK